ncbi:MAG TPA: acyltransferase [Acidobacteriaceae bacterium]|nr:acyltransferase [Acidobacteriaceae bacterium]
MPSARFRAATGRRDPALDGLRGVAILLVYIFHYGGGLRSTNPLVRGLGYFTETGWTGVILFFALSGFLITGSLWDSREERDVLRNFYTRRVLRIFPLYYAVILIALLASIARGTRLAELTPVLLYAGFLQNLPGLVSTALLPISPLPLFHLWSLAVEEQFYILWPALVLFAGTRSRALNLSLWIVALSEVFRILTHLPIVPPAFATTLDPFLLTHAGTLALGAALALALRGEQWPLIERWAVTAFWSGVALYLLASWRSASFYLSPYPQFTVGLLGVGIASTAIIPIAMRTGRLRSILSSLPLRFLGRISYGFYVLHIFIEPLIDVLGGHAAHATSGARYQLARFLIAFPITVVLATMSYYLFELPILRYKRRFPMHSPLPDPAHTASNPSTSL